MLTLLLKTNEYNQLNLLAYLADNTQHNCRTIEKELNLTKETLYRYVNTLNYDLNLTQKETSNYISINKQKIFLTQQPDYSSYDLMTHLIQKYSRVSPLYQILAYMLRQQTQVTLQLLDKLNISHSYFNKLIKKINSFFKPYQLRLVQKNHIIYWEGDSVQLYFIHYLLWSYLYLVEPEMIKSTFEQTPLTFISSPNNPEIPDLEVFPLKLKLLQHTTYNYFAKHKHIVCDSTLYQSISSILITEHDFLKINHKKRLWGTETDKFLNLMIHLLAPYLISSEQRELVGKKFMSLEHPAIQSYQQHVSTLLTSQAIPLETTYHEMAYLLCLQQLSLEIMGTNFQSFFQINLSTDPSKISNSPDVNPSLAILLEKDCTYYPSHTLNYLTTMTCSDYLKKINIKLDLTNQLPYQTLFKKNITSLFNVTQINFTLSEEEADIIITDQIIFEKKVGAYFFMPDLFDPSALNKLFSTITLLYLSKITQKKK